MIDRDWIGPSTWLLICLVLLCLTTINTALLSWRMSQVEVAVKEIIDASR